MRIYLFLSFLFFTNVFSYFNASDYIPISEDEGYFISYDKNNIRKDDPVKNYYLK